MTACDVEALLLFAADIGASTANLEMKAADGQCGNRAE